LAEDYVKASGHKVKDIMSTQVAAVAEETPLSEVARLIQEQSIKRVPVLRGRELVGIVTRADLMRAVLSVAVDRPPSTGDAGIREQLFAELKRQPWAVPASMIDVAVKDGVVEFSGVVRDERQRQALRVAAEGIPGVRSVVDQALRIEPVIGLFVAQNED
jgi:CBS-domain-containing membrane protein